MGAKTVVTDKEDREERIIFVLSGIVGLLAGPLELLFVDVVLKNLVQNKINSLFWVLGSLAVFPIVYALGIFIVRLILYKKSYDFEKCWIIIRILAPISIFLTCFIINKFINHAGTISSIFQSLFFLGCNFLFFVVSDPGGDTEGRVKSGGKTRKLRADTWSWRGLSETTFRDEDGNKVGTVSSIDHGFVKDTVIKDSNGNETRIEDWKHKY